MPVSFTVSKVMNIVGIGYLIAGHCNEALVKPGALVTLNNGEVTFKIDAVEQIEYTEMSFTETALILEPLEDAAAAPLLTLLPGQVIAIK